MPCHNFSFGPITKVEALEEMGPIAKSRCKMKKIIHSCDNEVKIQDEKNIHSREVTISLEPRESFPRTHIMNSHFENWYPFKFKMFKEQH